MLEWKYTTKTTSCGKVSKCDSSSTRWVINLFFSLSQEGLYPICLKDGGQEGQRPYRPHQFMRSALGIGCSGGNNRYSCNDAPPPPPPQKNRIKWQPCKNKNTHWQQGRKFFCQKYQIYYSTTLNNNSKDDILCGHTFTMKNNQSNAFITLVNLISKVKKHNIF